MRPMVMMAPEAGQVLKTVVTADVIGGVMDEIVGLLPVVLPVMIGFVALRKGISFVLSLLHSA